MNFNHILSSLTIIYRMNMYSTHLFSLMYLKVRLFFHKIATYLLKACVKEKKNTIFQTSLIGHDTVFSRVLEKMFSILKIKKKNHK